MSEQNKPQDTVVNPNEFVYLGFGQRMMASIIDTFIQMLILTPIVILFFPHLLSVNLPYDPKLMAELQWLFLAILTPFLLVFWQSSQSTLGKMVFHSKIVDALFGFCLMHVNKAGTTKWPIRLLLKSYQIHQKHLYLKSILPSPIRHFANGVAVVVQNAC